MNPQRLLGAILVAFTLGCTKTDDYLHEHLKKHSELVDPNSVMFRSVTYQSSHQSSLWEVWCGELNAKNRMGGYDGWTPFSVSVYSNGNVFVTILQPQEAPFGANGELEQATNVLNKTMADIHAIKCKDAKQVSKWRPFWK